MSKLKTCTRDTRPALPENGDLLFETDTERLILYYDGWRAYGATGASKLESQSIDVYTLKDSELLDTLYIPGSLVVTTDKNVLYVTGDNDYIYYYGNVNSESSDGLYAAITREQSLDIDVDAVNIHNTDGTINTDSHAADININKDLELLYIHNDNFNHDKLVTINNPLTIDYNVESVNINMTIDTVEQIKSLDPQIGSIVTDVDSRNDNSGIIESGHIHLLGESNTDANLSRSMIETYSTSKSFDLSVESTSGRMLYSTTIMENYGGDFTIGVWFKLNDNDTTNDRFIFGYSSDRLVVAHHTDGLYIKGYGKYSGLDTAPGSITPDTWHHVCVTRDASYYAYGLYLDGAQIQSIEIGGSPNVYIRDIGGYHTEAGKLMDGLLASFTWWNEEFDAARVSELYNTRLLLPLTTTPVVHVDVTYTDDFLLVPERYTVSTNGATLNILNKDDTRTSSSTQTNIAPVYITDTPNF